MAIILTIDDEGINDAIKGQVEALGIDLTNKHIGIKLIAGRGDNGNSAEVTISNAVEKTAEAPAVKSPAPKATSKKEAIKAKIKEAKPPITKEPPAKSAEEIVAEIEGTESDVGSEEPSTEVTSPAAEKKKLFGS